MITINTLKKLSFPVNPRDGYKMKESIYKVGDFVNYDKFYSDLYFVYKDDPLFKHTHPEVFKPFIRHRSGYIADICDSAALIDDLTGEIISYIFYRVSGDVGPILYFAYTRKDDRKKGYIKRLCRDVGIDTRRKIWVSFIGTKDRGFFSLQANYVRHSI